MRYIYTIMLIAYLLIAVACCMKIEMAVNSGDSGKDGGDAPLASTADHINYGITTDIEADDHTEENGKDKKRKETDK